jgi:hypothetical protein
MIERFMKDESGLALVAAKYSYGKRKRCQAETNPKYKKACQNKADDASTFARCELASAVTGTQREKAAQDRSNAALGETCFGSPEECFEKRKAALVEVSGAQTVTDTDVKMKLKNIAAEKATGVMDACRIDFKQDKAAIKVAHTSCLDAAKQEYTKFDPTGATMSGEELESILKKSAMAHGSNDFAACAKEKCGGVCTESSKKDACIAVSIASVASKVGRNPADYNDANNDFENDLLKEAGLISAANKDLCVAAAVKNVDCEEEYKKEFAERTGVDASKISAKDIATAEDRKAVEESINAMKTFAEQKCDSSAAVCNGEKLKLLAKTLNKQLDLTDLEKYTENAAREETERVQKSCRTRGTSSSECDKTLKKAIEKVTGKAV